MTVTTSPQRLSGLALRLFGWIFLVLVTLPVAAQLPGASKMATPAVAEAQKDPLDRGSPRRAIAAFIRAADRDDWVAAARYAQPSGARGEAAEQRLRELHELMDRYFQQPLTSISDSPEGALDDGLPLERERIGPLKLGEREHYIELVRTDDKAAGQVWLISSDTLARVPMLHAAMRQNWVERILPAPFLAQALFGFSAADLVLWAGSFLLPLLVLRLLSILGNFIVHKLVRNPVRRAGFDAWHDSLHWPVLLVLIGAVHLSLVPWFGPSLSFRILYSRIVMVVLVALLAWLLQRLLVLVNRRASNRMQMSGRTGTRSLLLLGERVMQVLIVILALLAMLAIGGFDIKTALAGLGIIGFAVALGAQKTVENMLGGMLLLGDEAIAIGDVCSVSGRTGVVEDITLRSVRIRTTEQTVLSIPAGVLAQANIENFSSRSKILAHTTLRLTLDTSCEQLRNIREGVAALMKKDPRIEADSSRVRLIDFTAQGVELELFAYVLTRDLQVFLAVREELLLEVASVVEAAGSAFARPFPATTAAEPVLAGS